MPFAELHNQRIHYEDTGGNGPAVVLSHGFLMDLAMFDPQVKALAPHFRLIRWDQRGFGKTESDDRPFTYWDSAADCIALLDHLGIAQAALAGMSQGGFLSMRAALLHPNRVKALVLIDTEPGLPEETTTAGYRQMHALWIEHGPIDPLMHSLASIILGDSQFWEPWITLWRPLSPQKLAHAVSCLLDRDDITHRMPELTLPALVIHGTKDIAIPLARAKAMSQLLPQCQGLVAVEGGGHATNLTHPEAVNPPLIEFLKAYA